MSLSRRFSNYKLVLYVPEDHIELVQEYVKECKQTELTASARIIQFVEEDFNALQTNHKVSVMCELCGEVVATKFVVYISGKRLWSCDNCYLARATKNLVKSVLKEIKEEEHFNPNLYGAK